MIRKDYRLLAETLAKMDITGGQLDIFIKEVSKVNPNFDGKKFYDYTLKMAAFLKNN
jgi:hypothetical protein